MKNNYLFFIIIIQPVLDIVAFWTASGNATVAGYLRLLIMAALAVYTVIHNYKNKKTWIAFGLIALVFSAHIINGFRIGYNNFTQDVIYISRVVYMPVLAVCFCFAINDESDKNQVVNGIFINAVVVALVIAVSYVTKTFTYTYGENLGISGWVTLDNRCCHSDILSTICIFVGYYAVSSKKKWVNLLLPIALFVLLITNGTRACYTTLFAISAGYAVYIMVRSFITHEKIDKSQRLTAIALACVFAGAIIIYPYTPRAKEEEYKRSYLSTVEKEFVTKMNSMGYDIYNMTLEEKMSEPTVHEELRDYYNKFMWGGIHQIVDRFDLDTIIYKYGGTIDSSYLGDTRVMKQKYAGLIFDTCDSLTKLTGFEIAQLGEDLTVDMENDYYSILYYYGYLGLAFYILAALYVFYRIIRKLILDFKASLSDINFCLLLAFCIQLGLAYFSGAMFRRPGASIYLALVAGLLYYETEYNSTRV